MDFNPKRSAHNAKWWKRQTLMKTHDITIIGGGIVGISTALQLKQRYPEASVLLLEKETHVARHQTGHNSGVIHAGVYYQPGSLKADFCKRGREKTLSFCRQYDLPYDLCGKLLVATDEIEMSRLDGLEKRCAANGITVERWDEATLHSAEPNIVGLAALWVPGTGITDYPRISRKMGNLFSSLGGEICLGAKAESIAEGPSGISIDTRVGRLNTRYLVVCGGLQADRLARCMGIGIDFRIVPFRGEYYRLAHRHRRIVQRLIYPVPDPDLPFLGVHLTRMIDGSVTVGPNAVLGWKREGYGRLNLDVADTREMLSFPGFWRVIGSHWNSGVGEWRDSLYKPGYLARVRKYCPRICAEDLLAYPAGIRAQAVLKDGSLVHDFLFAESERSLHVCNAPSPAATSAIPIGAYLCDKIKEKFGL